VVINSSGTKHKEHAQKYPEATHLQSGQKVTYQNSMVTYTGFKNRHANSSNAQHHHKKARSLLHTHTEKVTIMQLDSDFLLMHNKQPKLKETE